MKKLVIITFLLGIVYGQGGAHIHHLYGVNEDVLGIVKIGALNQQADESVIIETATQPFIAGAEFTYWNVNNNVFFLDTSAQTTLSTIYQYELPDIFSSSYAGLNNTLTIQGGLNAIFANPLDDSFFYGLDNQFTNRLYYYSSNLFQINSTPLFVDQSETFSAVALSNDVYTAFQFNNQLVLDRYDSSLTQLINSDSLNQYNDLKLVGHPNVGLFGIATDFQEQHTLVIIDQINLDDSLLVNLPSCANCVTETFEYDKNGMVINPVANQLILSRKETISGITKNYLTTINLSTGAIVYNIETQDYWTNLIWQEPLNDLVYPGDANGNQLVDMTDLLPIGLRHADFVTERNEISLEWIGQPAILDQDTFINGVSKSHADCNGDGQINAIDVNAILRNYDYIHFSEKSTQSECSFPLYIDFPNQVKEGDTAIVQIGLDLSSNALQDVYGVVFTLEYDSSFVVPQTMETEGVNAWFGTNDLDFITEYVDHYEEGKIDVGIVGIDQLNRNGGGILLNGIWTMEDEVIPIAQNFGNMSMRITNVLIIDYDENVIDACGVDTELRVYDKSVSVREREFNTLGVYPNPSPNGQFKISAEANLKMAIVYDLQGKEVYRTEIEEGSLQVSHLNNGAYLLKCYDILGNVYSSKIHLNKK